MSEQSANQETLQAMGIRDQVLIEIDGDSKLNRTVVARESGISQTTLSLYLQGKYAGDEASIETKLTQWMGSRHRRVNAAGRLPAGPTWIATPTSDRVLSVLAYAQMASDMAVIYGGAGVGKTSALRHYAATNPNVWIVTMSPDAGTVVSSLEEIAEALGMKGYYGSPAKLRREVAKRIHGTNGLLVIDEAQHLNIASLETIRSIHDATEIAIVLCGNENVYSRLTGQFRTSHFAQLFSRLGKRLRLTLPSTGDVAAIAEFYGVASKGERDALIEISKKPGALRGVVKTLRLAGMLAGGTRETITLDHIRAAWRDLSGEE